MPIIYNIVTRVTRKFAVDSNIFVSDEECINDMEIRMFQRHAYRVQTSCRVQLISLICRKYLTLRMFSHAKKLSKTRPFSNRQRLNRLILFSNN